MYIYICNKYIYIYIYIYISATRHLRFRYISILTNLPRTDSERNLYKKYIQLDKLKKIKRTKRRLKIKIKML